MCCLTHQRRADLKRHCIELKCKKWGRAYSPTRHHVSCTAPKVAQFAHEVLVRVPGLHVPLEEGQVLRSVVAVAARKVPDVIVADAVGSCMPRCRRLGTRSLSGVIGNVAHYPYVVAGAVVTFGACEVLRLEVAVPLLHNGRLERAAAANIFFVENLKKMFLVQPNCVKPGNATANFHRRNKLHFRIKSSRAIRGVEILKTAAHAPELAAKVLRRHVRELVMREKPTTAVGAEIALGAIKSPVFVVTTVGAVVFFFHGVHVEVPN